MLHFETGKYAAYVWPAYGLTALMFVVLIADLDAPRPGAGRKRQAKPWRATTRWLAQPAAGRPGGACGYCS